MVTGAFYFHTVMPVVEFLAERYHMYEVVMRFDGATDERILLYCFVDTFELIL